MAAKRMKNACQGIDRNKFYALDEAVKMLKERAKAKFDETFEIALNLGIDPRHSDQNVRGVVQLPNGTGKSLRVAVFARGEKAKEAEKAGPTSSAPRTWWRRCRPVRSTSTAASPRPT